MITSRQDGSAAEWKELALAELPEGDVLVRVQATGLNYKDALAMTGRGKVVRAFPMVPGIDLAGIVAESRSPRWRPGDRVLLTGWGAGEAHWGGFAEYARVRAEWLTPLPAGFTPERAMTAGTAGFTAMLAVMALEDAGVTPERGEIAVTGAGGGVGGFAIALLAALGYAVTAVTRREALAPYLRSLGARAVIPPAALGDPQKPLQSERWAGAVDAVGGGTLAALLAATAYRGCVAACGLAGSAGLPGTVFPFILRGVRLTGIDSVYCPQPLREKAWPRLAALVPATAWEEIGEAAPLEEALTRSEALLRGEARGRTVFRIGSANP
jgi:acrylyl-CoA reductase (NADPH)